MSDSKPEIQNTNGGHKLKNNQKPDNMPGKSSPPAPRPVTPDEILEEKNKTIPGGIILAINELIALHWNGSEASFYREDLFAKYSAIMNITHDRQMEEKLITAHALEFIPMYKQAGWEVVYHHPDMTHGDMDFEPFYTFKRL